MARAQEFEAAANSDRATRQSLTLWPRQECSGVIVAHCSLKLRGSKYSSYIYMVTVDEAVHDSSSKLPFSSFVRGKISMLTKLNKRIFTTSFPVTPSQLHKWIQWQKESCTSNSENTGGDRSRYGVIQVGLGPTVSSEPPHLGLKKHWDYRCDHCACPPTIDLHSVTYLTSEIEMGFCHLEFLNSGNLPSSASQSTVITAHPSRFCSWELDTRSSWAGRSSAASSELEAKPWLQRTLFSFLGWMRAPLQG
ncbi:hypothetical protein AAY473_011313 [Plecturocebus cupreus]